MPRFQLSAEEAAFVIAHLGDEELALRVLLATATPPATAEEASDRLDAAHRLLNSRGLINVADDGSWQLDPDLASIAVVTWAPRFTIGISRSRAGTNAELSFHFRDDLIVQEEIEAGSVYVIEELPSLDAVIDAATSFFAIEATTDATEVSLPATLLDQLSAASTEEEARTALTYAGAAEALLQLFAADYVLPALRGGFVRTGYGHGHPVSEAGAFIVGGNERAWLLRLDGHNVGNLLLVPATRASIGEEVVRLTRR